MSTTHAFAFSTVVGLALALAPLRSASACSGSSCYGGDYLPASGTVPASLPAILFNPRVDEVSDPSTATVSLFRVQNGSQVPVDSTTTLVGSDLVLTPKSPLVPDADYALEGSDLCAQSLVKATFHTGATASLPASLGALAAGAQKVGALDVWTASGACTTSVTAAQIDVNLTLSSDAAPWAAALSFVTLVDGKPWNPAFVADGASHWGSSHSRLFTTCTSNDSGADKGLAEGAHAVVMQATLQGTSMMLKSDPITVTLACPSTVAGAGGAGGGGGGGAGGGGGVGGAGGHGQRPETVGGCNVGGKGEGSAWALVGAAAVIAMRTRRSRRALRVPRM